MSTAMCLPAARWTSARRTGGEDALAIGGERGDDLVARGREMPEDELLASRAGPTVQVPLLSPPRPPCPPRTPRRLCPSVPAQPAPHHAIPDAELARQRR